MHAMTPSRMQLCTSEFQGDCGLFCNYLVIFCATVVEGIGVRLFSRVLL